MREGSNRCVVCKRPLTNPIAIDLRMGKICASRKGFKWNDEKAKDQLDLTDPFPAMSNRRMAEKLHDGRALDVRFCERTPEGDYILKEFDEDGDFDYCDSKTESWIWSIGQFPDGRVLAATSSKFYQNPACRCVWLR